MRVSQPAAAGHTEYIVKLPSPLTEWRLDKRVPHAVQTGVSLGDRGYVLMS